MTDDQVPTLNEVRAMLLTDLVADPSNVRLHNEDNIESIMASLRRFGQQRPILVGKGNVVVAGNGTLEAARRLGWDRLLCVLTELEGDEARAYAIADNKIAELAEWDINDLTESLKSFKKMDDAYDFKSLGFGHDEVMRMLNEPDFTPIDESEVASLDKLEPIVCPKCGHTWNRK